LGLQFEVLNEILSVLADIKEAVNRQFQLFVTRTGQFIILIGKDTEFKIVRAIVKSRHRIKQFVVFDAVDQRAFFIEKLHIKIFHLIKKFPFKI